MLKPKSFDAGNFNFGIHVNQGVIFSTSKFYRE